RCDSLGSNCADISGATSSTYTLTPSDVGGTVKAVVTGTNVAGNAAASSSASPVVIAQPPVNTTPPTITGTVQDGQTLTGSNGTWTGTPTITYAYQWRRCDTPGTGCADMDGAAHPNYTLTPRDAGAT